MSPKKKALILAVLFLLTSVLSLVSGKEAGVVKNEGSTLQAASLPVLCFSFGDDLINPLYAYTGSEVEGVGQDSVYPLTDDKLDITVHMVDSRERPGLVSYELRSESDKHLLSRGSFDHFETIGDDRCFTLHFQDILQEDTYYLLKLTLTLSRGEAYYYTRVMRLSDAGSLNRLVEYGGNMHSDIFSRDAGRSYGAKLETDTKTDKDTLAYVNINGSYDQLTWGESGARPVSDTWMTIEAVHENYVYLRFACLVEADYAEDEPVRLKVWESIALQRNQNAVYLLTYERHAEQIWEFTDYSVLSAGILLGVQEADRLQRISDASGRYTAFTVAGELYLYDEEQMCLTRIFSMRQRGEHALRTLRDGCRVKIMEVDQNGRVEFVVYGYMNGGPYEGNCGLSYCVYEADSDEVREQMYLMAAVSEAVLEKEVSRLFVKGNDHFLYFLFNEEVLVMDIVTGETAVLVSRAESPALRINESGTAFAWPVGTDADRPQSVRVVDLKSGMRKTILAEEGGFLQPLGYIREDLVLGYGSLNSPALSDGEKERYAMDRFVILDEALEEIYRYQKENVRIDSLRIGDEKVIIHRYGYAEGKYSYLEPDVMLRSDGGTEAESGFTSTVHSGLKRLAVLSYPRLPSSLRIDQKRVALFAEGPRLSLPSEEGGEANAHFFAYGKGRLLGTARNPGEAIDLAGACYAYVVSREGRLIWCWSPTREECILTPTEELLSREKKALDLTGASLRELYYYLNRGQAVRWICPEQDERWLIGYEWGNVVLYRPENALTYRMTQAAFQEALDRDNNYLWVYDTEER